MPLTGLANAAIDRVAPDKAAFAAGLTRYAEADLACYRADGPRALVERQSKAWDPLLDWARRRFDVDFQTTCGVIHVPQPPATVDRLGHAVAALDPFRLAGLSPLVTIGGSLVAALAVIEKAITPERRGMRSASKIAGSSSNGARMPKPRQVLASRRRDFLAAAQFLELLDA